MRYAEHVESMKKRRNKFNVKIRKYQRKGVITVDEKTIYAWILEK
jgi:hypothetical protein